MKSSLFAHCRATAKGKSKKRAISPGSGLESSTKKGPGEPTDGVSELAAVMALIPIESQESVRKLTHFLILAENMVRARGLEPPILTEPDPKSGASAIPPRAR